MLTPGGFQVAKSYSTQGEFYAAFGLYVSSPGTRRANIALIRCIADLWLVHRDLHVLAVHAEIHGRLLRALRNSMAIVYMPRRRVP